MDNILPESPRRAGATTIFAIMLGGIFLAGVVFLAAGHSRGNAGGEVSATGKWTCSMCPQFILPAPGKCPKCFMDLIPLENEAGSGGRFEIILSRAAVQAAEIESVIVEKNPTQPAGFDRFDISEKGPAEAAAEKADAAVLVPATAVLRNVGRAFVFIEADEGETLSFTLREIELGVMRGDSAVVRAGLHEGEAVVSRGAFRLDSALQIQGKISLVNLPKENLALVPAEEVREPYQPAERISLDLRAKGVPLDDWFKDYELVRAALAQDDAAASEKPAEFLLRSVEAKAGETTLSDHGSVGVGDFSELRRRLIRETGLLSSSRGLDEKRDAFEKVTADMVLLARKYGAPKSSLNLIFCPMAFGGAGAYWLQPQDKVDNPYHGLEMPECGWQVERIEP